MDTKRELASTTLIRATIEAPYFATALWALKFVPTDDDGPKYAAIDQKWRLYYNHDKWTTMPVEVRMGLVMHELSHVLRRHFQRAGAIGITNADAAKWNIACDLEINTWITNHRVFTLPDGALLPSKYGLPEGLLAEEYYNKLPSPPSGKTGTPPPQDCGSGAHNQPRPWEHHGKGRGAVDDIGQKSIEQSTKAAMSGDTTGDVPQEWSKWADTDPDHEPISWQQEVAQAIRNVIGRKRGMVDYSYQFPNRRQSAYGKVVMPALVAPIPNVCIVQDTSGSMSPHDLGIAYKQVTDIITTLGQPVEFIEVDAAVHSSKRITKAKRKLTGGGGTDMGVGIDAARKLQPDLLIVLTDGYTPWPEKRPRCRVVVVITNDHQKGPTWAKTINMK